MVESNEKRMQEQQEQQQQQQMQIAQETLQQKTQMEQAKMEQEYRMNVENNDTKVLIAQINSQAESDRLALMNRDYEEDVYTEKDKADLAERIREFDAKLKLDNEKLAFEKSKAKKDQELKAKQISKQSKNNTKK